MKPVLETRLTGDFLAETEIRGTVHSKFRRTANLAFPGRLITLALPEVPGLPDSITVSREVLEAVGCVPEGASVVKKGLLFCLDGGDALFSLEGADRCSDAMPAAERPVPVQQLLEAAGPLLKDSGFSRMTPYVREELFGRLHAFCQSLSDGGTEAALLGCAGIGCGLTPSSDDALVGILAAQAGGILLRGRRVNPHRLWSVLEGRTTCVSRKYLCCAAERRFSQPLRALFDDHSPDTLESRLKAAAAVGSTSGRDTLTGIVLACRFRQMEERNA